MGGASVAPWGGKAAKEAEAKAIATVATSGNGGPGSAVGGTSGAVVGRKRHPDEGQRIRRLAYFAERLSVAFHARFHLFEEKRHSCVAVCCCEAVY